ncbi:MAG: hypothetical protein U9O96_02285, partial [Candidatus Thermoplasmatota archaeon]|nr:hypothetical protein [Candidatus Thermoplasmatota archaeon]
MEKKALSVLVILCFLVSAAFSTWLIEKEDSKSVEFWEHHILSFNKPDNVTVVIDIMRVRTMTVKEDMPNIYFKIYINGEDSVLLPQSYKGKDIWIEEPVASKEISYNPEEKVNIQIQVWKKELLFDKPCDISRANSPFLAGRIINISYDVKRGGWTGDDYLGDENGYGHCSGFEDGNENENDCEIWFDIYQSGDGWDEDHLTYWEKVNIYDLNVSRDYTGEDFDGDSVPIEWEDKYGYDPFVWDNHANMDPDEDGLTDVEEWKTSKWLSDPFAQDIFVEVDGMEGKYSWSKPYIFPKESQYLLCNAFARHDITIHIDDGNLNDGGNLIPYDGLMSYGGLISARSKYFLHWNQNNWKRGVFHYAIICCQIDFSRRPAGGMAFYIDSFTIGGQYVRNWTWSFYLQGSDYYTAFASVFMHELGHTLGLNGFAGIDN